MFRYNNGLFRQTPPATIDFKGFTMKFSQLTREQWDEAGYNEAIPIEREPHTIYETVWVKGDDLIFREEVISVTVNKEERDAAQAKGLRIKRDILLSESDWTQLSDTSLDAERTVLWQSYRQALRDVPQQPGFPATVDWPERPLVE